MALRIPKQMLPTRVSVIWNRSYRRWSCMFSSNGQEKVFYKLSHCSLLSIDLPCGGCFPFHVLMTFSFLVYDLHFFCRWLAFFVRKLAFFGPWLTFFQRMTCIFFVDDSHFLFENLHFWVHGLHFFRGLLAFFVRWLTFFFTITCIFWSMACIFWRWFFFGRRLDFIGTKTYIFLVFVDEKILTCTNVDTN